MLAWILEGLQLLLDLEELDLAQVRHRCFLVDLALRVSVDVFSALLRPFHFVVLGPIYSLALFVTNGLALAPAGEVDFTH